MVAGVCSALILWTRSIRQDPARSNRSASFDWLYQIATFSEFLQLIKAKEQELKRRVVWFLLSGADVPSLTLR
jgi:hypothetical protein